MFPFSTAQTEKNSGKKIVKQIGENIWWICYKISDLETAEDYGIEDLPTVVYFENGIPFVYMGNIFHLFI